MVFDSPESNVCLAQRNRSNTPLQALTTLNDPVFFECAQVLGRQLAMSAASTDQRLQQAAMVSLSRPLASDELQILRQLHADETTWFSRHPDEAKQVVGAFASHETATHRVAAWIGVARTLLNLDEFLTRD